jgi:hypothetical protein
MGFFHWFDHFIRELTILVFYDMIADFPFYWHGLDALVCPLIAIGICNVFLDGT